MTSGTVSMGDFEAGESHFAAGEATDERVGAHAWLARTRLGRARMRLARRRPGEAEGAAGLLASAIAAATELGFAGVEGRARRLLAITGKEIS